MGRDVVASGRVLDSKSGIIQLSTNVGFVAVWRMDLRGAAMKDLGRWKDWKSLELHQRSWVW